MNIEPLEARIAPATIFVVDASNHLLRFDSNTPGAVTSFDITGLAGGGSETVEGIDFRPATGELYALGIVDLGATDEARIYTLNPTNGVATLIPGSVAISVTDGTDYGFDFNPTVDRIRIVNDADENLRVDPENGLRVDSTVADVDLIPAGNVTGVAYDRNFIGGATTATTLYAIDSVSSRLVTIGGLNGSPSPNAGMIADIGALGVTISGTSGFDISENSTAFAAMTVGGVTGLYSIELGGTATSRGAIGTGATPLKGLAVLAFPVEFKIVNAKTATLLDLDGDLITIKTTKGTFDAGQFGFGATADGVAGGAQLTKLKLDASFTGAAITFTAKKAPGGDGLANVGLIDATGVDLASVTVKGDLARIFAGDPSTTTATPALKSLSVLSMGALGTFTVGGGSNLGSFISGKLGSLKVATDFTNAFLNVNGTDGRIDSIFIGGDLIGTDLFQGGRIFAFADIKTAKIVGDIVGGSAISSGQLITSATLHALTVGGSVIGGAGVSSGNVIALQLAKATIGHDLVGGTGVSSGRIRSAGTIANVTIGGDVIGGAGASSGSIDADVSLSKVLIKGNVTGGAGSSSGRLHSSMAIGAITVAGDLVGGGGSRAGSIESDATTGAVTIGGSMRGGSGSKSGSILTLGALGKVTVARDVFGGSNFDSGEITSDLSIASVQIGGNLVGGTGGFSGVIRSLGTIGDVLVKGSVIGAAASEAGAILSGGDMGPVRIGGDLIGGSTIAAVTVQTSGAIRSSGGIASVTLGGSLIAGFTAGAGSFFNSGAIIAGDDLGPVKIAGSILGNSTHAALISGGGQPVKPATGFDVAIASVTVGRNVQFAKILAGVDTAGASMNADASIGTVVVGGHWTASSIAAGIENSFPIGYGVGNTIAFTGDTALIARIASVTIKGTVSGSNASGDNFGFVAQQIDFLKIGANAVALTAGASNDDRALPFTNDVHILEVA